MHVDTCLEIETVDGTNYIRQYSDYQDTNGYSYWAKSMYNLDAEKLKFVRKGNGIWIPFLRTLGLVEINEASYSDCMRIFMQQDVSRPNQMIVRVYSPSDNQPNEWAVTLQPIRGSDGYAYPELTWIATQWYLANDEIPQNTNNIWTGNFHRDVFADTDEPFNYGVLYCAYWDGGQTLITGLAYQLKTEIVEGSCPTMLKALNTTLASLYSTDGSLMAGTEGMTTRNMRINLITEDIDSLSVKVDDKFKELKSRYVKI